MEYIQIIGRMSDTELLDQLVEECAELIQACIKLKRVHAKLTPITENRARQNLVEELADVAVVHEAVARKVLSDAEQAEMGEIAAQKCERWMQRLNVLRADK